MMAFAKLRRGLHKNRRVWILAVCGSLASESWGWGLCDLGGSDNLLETIRWSTLSPFIKPFVHQAVDL